MKTIIQLLTIILFVSQSVAQITLTSSNNPAPGDVDFYSSCDTTNISPGNAGINQTWNFTSLTRLDSTTVSFVSASSTIYAGQFPGSNIASTSDMTDYNFFTTSETGILINGNAGPGLTANYSDPQLFMQYPFNFNSNVTDNFAANFTSGSFETYRTGTTTISGDAWGTINLPSGSFPNALRVKYVIVTNDSSNTGVVLTSTLTSYNWFAAGRKFPVFEIIYINYLVNGFPLGSEKVVNYSTNSTIGISNISTISPGKYDLSQNYPNPFNPVTTIRFEISEPGIVSLKIFNNLGREVSTLVNGRMNAGSYKYDFDASGLTSGVYYYTLKVNEFTETKKMFLVK
jgi:hypothetical protein